MNSRSIMVLSLGLLVVACNPGKSNQQSELAFSQDISKELDLANKDLCKANQVSIHISNGEEVGTLVWHQSIPAESVKMINDRRTNNNDSFVQAQWQNFYHFTHNALFGQGEDFSECLKTNKTLTVFDGPGDNDTIIITIVDGKISANPSAIDKGFFESRDAGYFKDQLQRLRDRQANFDELDMTTDLPGVVAEFKEAARLEELAKSVGSAGINYFVALNSHGGVVDLNINSIEKVSILSPAVKKSNLIFFDSNSKSATSRRSQLSAPVWLRASVDKICAREKIDSADLNHVCNTIKSPLYDAATLNALYAMGPKSLTDSFATLAAKHSVSVNLASTFNRLVNPRGLISRNDREFWDETELSQGVNSVDGEGGTSSVGREGGTSSVGREGGTSSVGREGGTSSVGREGGTSSVGGEGGTSSVGGEGGTSGKELVNFVIDLSVSKLKIDYKNPVHNLPEGAFFAAPAMSYDSQGLNFNLPNPSGQSLVLVNSCYQSPELASKFFHDHKYTGSTLWTDAPVYSWLIDYSVMNDYRVRALQFLINSEDSKLSESDRMKKTNIVRLINQGFGLERLIRISIESERVNRLEKAGYFERVLVGMQSYFGLSEKSLGLKLTKNPR